MDTTRKFIIGITLVFAIISFLALSSSIWAAFGDQLEAGFGPPPMRASMGFANIGSDQSYLYVMAGPKLMQYGLSDLKLVKAVELPELRLPEPPPAQRGADSMCPPPPMPPRGLWVGESFLYVMDGPMIYQYSIPDMALQTSAELPKPEIQPSYN
ncbi:MAG: hypothetical protein ACLGPL_03385 [Acidobacteriota bacterium]